MNGQSTNRLIDWLVDSLFNQDSEHLYLLMEYCDGYDMYEYLVQANKLP